jgi:hypothetical protein
MSTTAAAITIRDHTLGATTSVDAVAGALAVVWCRSVGTSWTLELYEPGGGGALGTITDWIPSGVPISQPQPSKALARELLAQRGLLLFGDSSAGSCTHNRRGVGYVHPKR